jgi:hypothetical protein
MVRNKGRNLFDIATTRGGGIGSAPHGQQMTGPGLASMNTGSFWAGTQDWSNFGINNWTDWYNNWNELQGEGHFSEFDDYYDWYENQQGEWNQQWGGGGGNVGGSGDLGFGNMYTGGAAQNYDCVTQGPAYNSAGQCIACCP